MLLSLKEKGPVEAIANCMAGYDATKGGGGCGGP